MELLVKYKDWLSSKFKETSKSYRDIKVFYKDILLKGMTTELINANQMEGEPTTKSDNVVYYIGGYLVLRYKRRKVNRRCSQCLSSMDCGLAGLPKDFSAKEFNQLKTKGGLRFVSTALFSLLQKVEKEIQLVLAKPGAIFGPSSFQMILHSLCDTTLPQVGCEKHHMDLMTGLIQDFMTIRVKYIAKQKKIEISQQAKAVTLARNKLAKM